MAKTLNTEVLIVGAGPTGLMAANQLARFGIETIIIDKKNGPTRESRAIAVTARSLEIYQQMGISGEAVSDGKKIKSFNLFAGGKPKAEVIIGEIGKGLSEFSFMLAFEQSKNETLLYHHLKEQGIDVNWNYEFVELKEWKDSICALVNRNGETLEIEARYLIACDGAGSPIRQQLGFGFKGGTYEHRFFVADTEMQWGMEYDKLIIAPGDQNFCAFLPLYGDMHYRVIGTLPKAYSNKEDVSFRDIENTVIQTLGIDLQFKTVKWFSTYKLHHRMVDRFRKGNVFLAGDSAHIHSPAGGQGMNTGLQDAYNLGWKIALVLKRRARPTLLNTYDEERLPFARWLLRFTDRGFNMMTSTNWFIAQFRKIVVVRMAGLVVSSLRIRPFIFKILSQIWYSYGRSSLSKNNSSQRLKFGAGDRMPFLIHGNIYPLLTKASFHLVHIGSTPLANETGEKISEVFPFSIEVVEQSLNRDWKELGVKKELFILVRPDNYIAFITDQWNKAEFSSYLKKYFSG